MSARGPTGSDIDKEAATTTRTTFYHNPAPRHAPVNGTARLNRSVPRDWLSIAGHAFVAGLPRRPEGITPSRGAPVVLV
jgi:hypothetical protein